MRCHAVCSVEGAWGGFSRRWACFSGALGLMCLLCVTSSAKDEISTNKLHMIGSTPERPAAVVIERPADYIAIPVTITADTKESNKKEQAAIEIATDLLKSLAKNSNSKFKGRMVSTSRQPYLYLLMRTDEAPDDLAKCELLAEEMFKKVFFTGMTRCELGSASLAVDDPESSRSELMGMIFKEVEKLSKILGEDVLIKIGGLECPVQVRSGEGMTVNLFINYKLSVEAKAADLNVPATAPARR